MSNLETYLRVLTDREGTDLYLVTGAPASISVSSKFEAIDAIPLKNSEVTQMANAVMSADQQQKFTAELEMNLGLELEEIGRFRINIYRQRGETSMVIRRISLNIPTRSELMLPEIIDALALAKRGLIFVVGATNSGKSTTLASMIQHRSQQQDGHIVTIEDPIEYLHPHAKSLISQRELGIDTLSYEQGLQNALRQSPDVILIGEIRNAQTMEQALTFAETGHLCLATLHANNAYQALDRILHFFDESKRDQVLLDLSFTIKAIISQRLMEDVSGTLRVATEIMLGSSTIKDYIRQGKIGALKDIIARSENPKMHTFDQDLIRLVREGAISEATALKNADSENNLRVELKLTNRGTPPSDTPSSFSLKKE